MWVFFPTLDIHCKYGEQMQKLGKQRFNSKANLLVKITKQWYTFTYTINHISESLQFDMTNYTYCTKIIDISTSKLKNTVHPKNAEKVNISPHPHSLIFSFRTAALFAVMVWDFCLLSSRLFSLSLTAASSSCSLCWLALASVRETWCFAVSDSTLSVASLCRIRLVYNIMLY